MPRNVYLMSSSHLDREWYYSFEKFRFQICEVLDRVLSLLKDSSGYKCFLLDGQVRALEDFLEVYPEREEEIREFVKNGRLIIGPWYIQPDEFLPCGESHIRNLLFGIRISSSYGRVMRLGYIPDAFGHISQMPQILRGFSIDKAFFSRGVDTKFDREFLWQAPDGSRVLSALVEYGYCSKVDFSDMTKGIRLIDNADELQEKIEKLLKNKEPVPTTPDVLATYCSDHCPPACNLVEMVNTINNRTNEYKIHIASLEEYFNAIIAGKPTLKVFSGELRGSGDIIYLNDTLASRIHLKMENQRAQQMLLNFAEPISSFAWCEGRNYPKNFLDTTWKYLLLNHTHDGICGCSADVVNNEMMVRFQKCEDISERLITTAFKHIIQKININNIGDTDKALVIYNPLGYSIDDHIELDVAFKEKEKPDSLHFFDMESHEIPYHITGIREKERIESDINAVQRFYNEIIYKIVLAPGKLLPFGYKTLRVQTRSLNTEGTTSEFKLEGSVATGSNYMENEYIRVEINENGTFNLIDKEYKTIYRGIHYYMDSGDAGDVYNYRKPEQDTVFDSRDLKWAISLIDQGPLMARYRLKTEMPLPVSLRQDKASRDSSMVTNKIGYDITLYKANRYIRITTDFVNNSSDHRLRVMFPTRMDTTCSYADGQFIVEKRGIGQYPYAHPQQTFVDVNDGSRGFAVLNKGIPQYEVLRDGNTTIALTLLRCQDTLYRGFFRNNNEEFLGAQCKGAYTFEYAVYPHKGDFIEGEVYKKGQFFNSGVYNALIGKNDGTLPVEMSFISVEPDELAVTAVKASEDRSSLIVRFFNITDEKVSGKLKFYKKVKAAKLVSMNEEYMADLIVDNDSVPVNANPHQIVTVALEL